MATIFGTALLVTGSESLLAERAVATFVDAALAARPDALVTRLQAAQLDAGGLAEAAGGSLFADASVVVIDDLSSVPADAADAVIAVASRPGPDLAVVLVHPGGVKGKALLDKVKATRPAVVDCPPVKSWDLPQFAATEARRAGGRLEPAAAGALIDAVGSDLRALAGAIRQLLDDTDDRVVKTADVRRYFGGRAEVSSFAVADDALNGRTEGALGKLRWALSTGVAPVLVTSALSSNLRSLGKYLQHRDARMRDVDLARQLGIPPWKVKDVARQARDWTMPGVARAIQAVARADAQIKGAASDPGFALEQVVLTVIGCRKN